MLESPTRERALRYRELAAEADRMAEAHADSLSVHYRTIADLWRRLANETEFSIAPLERTPQPDRAREHYSRS
jgi:hypothetical protein